MVTLEEVTLLWIDRGTFRASVVESTVFSGNLAEILSKHVGLTNTRLSLLVCLGVPVRVAFQLLLPASMGRRCLKVRASRCASPRPTSSLSWMPRG